MTKTIQKANFNGCEFSAPAGKLHIACGEDRGSTVTKLPDGYYALQSRIFKVGGLPEAEIRGRDPEVAWVLEKSGKLDECARWELKDGLGRDLPDNSKAANLAIDVLYTAFNNLGGRYEHRKPTRESLKRDVKGRDR